MSLEIADFWFLVLFFFSVYFYSLLPTDSSGRLTRGIWHGHRREDRSQCCEFCYLIDGACRHQFPCTERRYIASGDDILSFITLSYLLVPFFQATDRLLHDVYPIKYNRHLPIYFPMDALESKKKLI